MKLSVLSEQLSGTVYITPEENENWQAMTQMVDRVLAFFGGKFAKKKGLLSWKVFRTSGVGNPADDWEDKFGEHAMIADVSYDKFSSRPTYELSFYRPLLPDEDPELYGESRLDFRQRFPVKKSGLRAMETLLKVTLAGTRL